MARSLASASSQNFTMGPGAISATPFTYGTMAGIVRSATVGAWRNIVGLSITSGAFGSGCVMELDNLNKLYIVFDASECFTTATFAQTTWLFVAATKATGTVAPRAHVYDYAAGTWTHADFANTAANGTFLSNKMVVGSFTDLTGDFLNGDIAAVGYFKQWVPTDAEIEACGLHISRLGWLVAAQRSAAAGVCLFDQSLTTMPVMDLTGGGANQTSTSASVPGISTQSVPLLSYGAPAISDVSAAAAAAAATIRPRLQFPQLLR